MKAPLQDVSGERVEVDLEPTGTAVGRLTSKRYPGRPTWRNVVTDAGRSEVISDLERMRPAPHELKTVQPFFDQVVSGAKSFEARRHDRDFRAGDLLLLREWNTVRALTVDLDGSPPRAVGYTGREHLVRATYVLDTRTLIAAGCHGLLLADGEGESSPVSEACVIGVEPLRRALVADARCVSETVALLRMITARFLPGAHVSDEVRQKMEELVPRLVELSASLDPRR